MTWRIDYSKEAIKFIQKQNLHPKLKEELKKFLLRAKGEWIAFLVLDETPEGKLKGKLIAHHKDRRSLHEILRKKKIKEAYMTFAGPLIKPGYAVLFL